MREPNLHSLCAQLGIHACETAFLLHQHVHEPSSGYKAAYDTNISPGQESGAC